MVTNIACHHSGSNPFHGTRRCARQTSIPRPRNWRPPLLPQHQNPDRLLHNRHSLLPRRPRSHPLHPPTSHLLRRPRLRRRPRRRKGHINIHARLQPKRPSPPSPPLSIPSHGQPFSHFPRRRTLSRPHSQTLQQLLFRPHRHRRLRSHEYRHPLRNGPSHPR